MAHGTALVLRTRMLIMVEFSLAMSDMATRLFIGNIAQFVEEKDVEEFFRGHGRLVDVSLKKGFGFVEFSDPRDAKDAIYNLNGKELCGKKIWLDQARKAQFPKSSQKFKHLHSMNVPDWMKKYGPPLRTENRVVVENLPTKVTWPVLKDMMRKVGEVTYAEAHNMKESVGMVEFASREDVKKAVEMLGRVGSWRKCYQSCGRP